MSCSVPDGRLLLSTRSIAVAFFAILLTTLSLPSNAFSTNSNFKHSWPGLPSPAIRRVQNRPSLALNLFGNNKQDENNGTESQPEAKKSRIPFFGRLSKANEEVSAKEGVATNDPVTVTATVTENKPPAPTVNTPADTAKALRAQAERARLEAEKMDAELTLTKIEKLERQLVRAKAKGDSVEDLQRQLENLQAKMRGEAPKPVVMAAPVERKIVNKQPSEPSMDAKENNNVSSESSTLGQGVRTASPMSMFGEVSNFEQFEEDWEFMPNFLKKTMAMALEIDFDTVDDLSAKALYDRLQAISMGDFSFTNRTMPTFTQAEIDAALQDLDNKDFPDKIMNAYLENAAGNRTKLAESVLAYEWYINSKIESMDEDSFVSYLEKVADGEVWMEPLISVLNQSTIDRGIESYYPKCTRKENAVEPTLEQVQLLATNVLPAAKFSATSKPEKVLGGYIIRGENLNKNGDELIAAIDKGLARLKLDDKMTVLFTPDITSIAKIAEADSDEEIIEIDIDDLPNILYILGPDIVRDRQRTLLSLTTSLGIASSWYLSIYPFLLNPTLAKRVEDQMALADASMAYDLNWLTDLSVPLFLAYIGIVAAHELGHRIVAAFYGMEISFPTLVPSIITGTTSTVTTFKKPPKNHKEMFDFSVAGPLAGIIASAVALFIGSELTAVSDPTFLPSLPIDILRQSSLGGGIIDSILKGVLYVPDGAPTNGIMISLHPLAVAGYVGLIVNALALLPLGSTDGGRIGLTLFGRPGKLVIGNIILLALLFSGLFGSDLFLFYFSFIIAFQTGNEIPSRNEVDELSFPRIIAATLAYCIAILTLVPFQQ